MAIDTGFLIRCIGTLEMGYTRLQQQELRPIEYDLYRAACVKEFEIVLQQSADLLKKRLRPFFASNREVDRLTFKDVFRHAVKHDLITPDACQRWFLYRDNRNDTAHDYGEGFAEATIKLLPAFISDASELAELIARGPDD